MKNKHVFCPAGRSVRLEIASNEAWIGFNGEGCEGNLFYSHVSISTFPCLAFRSARECGAPRRAGAAGLLLRPPTPPSSCAPSRAEPPLPRGTVAMPPAPAERRHAAALRRRPRGRRRGPATVTSRPGQGAERLLQAEPCGILSALPTSSSALMDELLLVGDLRHVPSGFAPRLLAGDASAGTAPPAARAPSSASVPAGTTDYLV
jgi:hypothetical protein